MFLTYFAKNAAKWIDNHKKWKIHTLEVSMDENLKSQKNYLVKRKTVLEGEIEKLQLELSEVKQILKNIESADSPPVILERKYLDYFEFPLTHLSVQKRYGIIRFPSEYRRKLAGYDVDFTLKTDIGILTSHVTSSARDTRSGDPGAGHYICGQLRPWFRRHPELREGQRIRITILRSKEIYSLDIIK